MMLLKTDYTWYLEQNLSWMEGGVINLHVEEGELTNAGGSDYEEGSG